MKSVIEKMANGMHYFMVDEAIVRNYMPSKRAICTIETVQFHCAFMPKKEGSFFVIVNKQNITKLKLKVGDAVTVIFKKDKTDLQFDMPEEFMEVMATDKEAKKTFDGLTDGNKRGIISLLLKIKSIDKRIEKSLFIAEKLKLGKKYGIK
jgi:hypothetical protein